MSDYVEYLQDVFALLGPTTARKMFGGYGVYHDGVMFALVADDMLYLKTDAASAPDFLARGLGPFEYDKGGRVVKMSYHLAPEEIMEDREQAAVWGRRALEAALRSRGAPRRS